MARADYLHLGIQHRPGKGAYYEKINREVTGIFFLQALRGFCFLMCI